MKRFYKEIKFNPYKDKLISEITSPIIGSIEEDIRNYIFPNNINSYGCEDEDEDYEGDMKILHSFIRPSRIF